MRLRLWGTIVFGSDETVLEADVDFDPNDAPEDLLQRIGTLGRPTFDSADDVVAELEASPTSG